MNRKGESDPIESDRLWISLDGIMRIKKYSKDTWTISHHNGTVVNIPTAAIEEPYIEHMRKKAGIEQDA